MTATKSAQLEQLEQAWRRLTEQGGFDRHFRGLSLRAVSEGEVLCQLVVAPELQNMLGKLHGGAVASLVDDVGTLALLASSQSGGRPGVTTDLHVSYFRPGDGTLLITGKVAKIGRTLAFVEVELRSEAGGEVVARGQMTKFL